MAKTSAAHAAKQSGNDFAAMLDESLGGGEGPGRLRLGRYRRGNRK